MGFLTEL